MNKKKNVSKEDLANNAIQNQKRKAQLAELEDIQIKAAYWKAQFEIRDYTLKAEAIQPSYDEYLEKEKQRNEELQKKWAEHIAKLKDNGLTAESLLSEADDKMVDVSITQDILDLNPEMAEQGLKIGDIIQVTEDSDLTPEELAEAEKEFEGK